MPAPEVLVVDIGSTAGWRAAARELAAAIRCAGATAELVTARPAPRVRTFALTDLVEARLARQAAVEGIARHRPSAVVYCSVTAALLWPRTGAIFLDSVAAENRPGRHGFWQRPLERRRLREAPLLLGWSPAALGPLASAAHAPLVVTPPPIDGHPGGAPRPIAALTYAGDPVKRRLHLVCDAWRRARRPDETLLVTGVDAQDAGIAPEPGIEFAGAVSNERFHELLDRARVFLAAPAREDFGIAALEALAHGCHLVTAPAAGPYPALALARELDPRLVSDDVAGALRHALDDPVPGYAVRAQELLRPYRRERLESTVAELVLPRLVGR